VFFPTELQKLGAPCTKMHLYFIQRRITVNAADSSACGSNIRVQKCGAAQNVYNRTNYQQTRQYLASDKKVQKAQNESTRCVE